MSHKVSELVLMFAFGNKVCMKRKVKNPNKRLKLKFTNNMSQNNGKQNKINYREQTRGKMQSFSGKGELASGSGLSPSASISPGTLFIGETRKTNCGKLWTC